VRLQSLALLVALLLVRQRQPPTGLADGGHVEVGVALMSLPSGLLAIIGQAMTKLESKLEVCHSPGLHTQKTETGQMCTLCCLHAIRRPMRFCKHTEHCRSAALLAAVCASRDCAMRCPTTAQRIPTAVLKLT
jgi:hypothetical protein